MKRYISILFAFFIIQNTYGQCKLTIIQRGIKSKIINQFDIIGQDSQFERINDSTVEFILNLTEPEYIYVLLDTIKHENINIGNNWHIRMWMAPEISRRELAINYSNKSFKIDDGIKWNKNGNNLHQWDSIEELIGQLDKSGKFIEEQNILNPYIEQHSDSYLSLWFFNHAHALYIESNDKKLVLFNKLNPALQKYPEYNQIKADLSGARKYPNKGDSFKEFTLIDMDNKLFNSANIKNKWILLHFWSNGCGPCIKEMDNMVKYYNTLDTSKISFYFHNVG